MAAVSLVPVRHRTDSSLLLRGLSIFVAPFAFLSLVQVRLLARTLLLAALVTSFSPALAPSSFPRRLRAPICRTGRCSRDLTGPQTAVQARTDRGMDSFF